jgi:hypothetical protein
MDRNVYFDEASISASEGGAMLKAKPNSVHCNSGLLGAASCRTAGYAYWTQTNSRLANPCR